MALLKTSSKRLPYAFSDDERIEFTDGIGSLTHLSLMTILGQGRKYIDPARGVRTWAYSRRKPDKADMGASTSPPTVVWA